VRERASDAGPQTITRLDSPHLVCGPSLVCCLLNASPRPPYTDRLVSHIRTHRRPAPQNFTTNVAPYRRQGLAPTAGCYTRAIRGLATGQRCDDALAILQRLLKEHGPSPEALSCQHAVMVLCGKMGRWEEALALLR
jgi:hypothetical protein